MRNTTGETTAAIGLSLSPGALLQEVPFNPLAEPGPIKTPFCEDVYLTESYAQGLFKYPDRDQILASLCNGEQLKLIREPENTINSNAIRLESHEGKKVGYVAMGDDVVIARLMDAGKTLIARISQIDPPALQQCLYDDKHVVRFNIYLQD